MKGLLYLIGKLFYRLTGWKMDPVPDYITQKHIIIGFPHTTNMDTVRAFMGFGIARKTGHIMIKKEWFFWPMSLVLKALGGVPVDRSGTRGTVEQMVNLFDTRDEFLLGIVPEGTRKEVTTIKTGFWHIAKGANVSILCWYLDNKAREARWLGEVVPGESKERDLIRIQELYEKAGYKIPLDIAASSPDK